MRKRGKMDLKEYINCLLKNTNWHRLKRLPVLTKDDILLNSSDKIINMYLFTYYRYNDEIIGKYSARYLNTAINSNNDYLVLFVSYCNNTDVLQYIWEKGFQLSFLSNCLFFKENNEGDNALMMAALGGHKKLFEFLLSNIGKFRSLYDTRERFSLHKTNNEGLNSYHYAIVSRNIELVKYLETTDINQNCKDINGNNAYIVAVLNSNIEIMGHLELIGFDFKYKNNYNENAYIFAIYSKNIKIMEYLENKGIDIDIDMALAVANIIGNNEIIEYLQYKKDEYYIYI